VNLDMTMFHQAFFEEATDILSEFEGLLLRLEETPDEPELLNTIFRCAHSIKGGSATFGFSDIAHFTHGLETLLDRLRNGQISVTSLLTQLLLESLDQMKALLAVARGEATAAPDSSALTARIEAAINGAGNVAPPSKPANAVVSKAPPVPESKQFLFRFVPGGHLLRQGANPALLLSRLIDGVDLISVACDLSRLPSCLELDPEECYLGWEVRFNSERDSADLLDVFEFVADESEVSLIEVAGVFIGNSEQGVQTMPDEPPVADEPHQTVEEPADVALVLPKPAPRPTDVAVAAAPPAARSEAPAAKSETHTLRVATDKIDKLINLVGELVINQSMLNEVIQDFSMAKLPRLTEAVAEMERASRELQERVMAVRMLPIKHAFGRFPRLIRDLAATCGKRIDLKTTGEDTELDKSVIEAIADPLTHLIRNSVDHGLETPQERKAAGKPEMGAVALHAFHEGGNIVIEVSDDGRGLNRDRILKKAIERGLLSESDPPPSDEVIHNFIFHPGFSTAAAVTDLSGRGVGMDIVKQAVQGLGGSIALSTTPGAGTRFRIRLPLTMAILEGLSLKVGDEVYILPLTSIVESIRPKTGDVRLIAGQSEVALVRGDVLPILRLYQFFGAPPHITDPTRGLLVIVENDGRKVALLVDELIGQSQVVIKSLESNYRKVDGIAGATILGDGRVALIVDVPGLIRGMQGGGAVYLAA
jgi:two-component system chemotaxis sensor kinase CheA